MAAKLYYNPFIPAFSNIGVPIAESRLYFYYTLTTTLAPIYADAALTVPLTNPVVANLAGKYPDIYLDGEITYKVQQTDKAGAPIGDAVDPYVPGQAVIVIPTLPELLAPDGASKIGYGSSDVESALDTYAAKLSKVVYVTDAPYNVTSAMTPAQQSAGIMACIDANRGGTITIPADQGLTYSGIILSGSTYNNTRLVVEDNSLFRANPNPMVGNFQTTIYCMFAFHDCDGCSLALKGVIDGNRTNQANSQQQPVVMLAGVTNFTADGNWKIKEIRGDGFTIAKKTFTDPSSANSDTVYIGDGVGINSANDGRNLVSVISGRNVIVGSCVSRNIGGIINAERMPGGFDCEPDHDSGHIVENLTVGDWDVETIGTSGFAVLGASISGNDANRDWNITNVQVGNVLVKHTDLTGLIGGPILRRVNGFAWGVIALARASRNAGIDADYLDLAYGTLRAKGCSTAITIGLSDFVNDSKINCIVDDYSAPAVMAVGIERSEIAVTARRPQGGGSYGLNIVNNSRAGLTQTNVRYTVDCPYDANLSFGIRCVGVTYGAGTAVVGGCMTGYGSYATQLATTDSNVIPTKNVIGRNTGAASVPTDGVWANGDFVEKSTQAAGGSPGWYSIATGAPNFKAAAAMAA